MVDTLLEVKRKIDSRFSALKDERNSFESHWRDIKDYLVPFRGRALEATDIGYEDQDGSKKHGKIYNSSPCRNLRVLTAGMQSGMTPKMRPWFVLGVPDPRLAEHDGVRRWLDTATNSMRYIFSKSNLYNGLSEAYLELGAFGVAAMALEEDFYEVIRTRSFTCGEYLISHDENFRVDSFYREIAYTAQQMKVKFGEEKLSKEAKAALDKPEGVKNRFVVRQVVEPNDDRYGVGMLKDAQNRPYRSVWYEQGTAGNDGVFLRIGGFDSFPIVAPRWEIAGNALYGTCPGIDMLADIKMLQKMEEDKIVLLDKLVNPPVVADPVLKNEVINAYPGAVTYAPGMMSGQRDSIRPLYQVQPDFDKLDATIGRTEGMIAQGFYNDLFLMLGQLPQKRMTATEVAERHEEKLTMLGPVLERLVEELLNPIIDRTFFIMMKNGLLPPPPPELQGVDLRIEYISILAQAQKMVGVNSMSSFIGHVTGLAETFGPEVLDKVDADEVVEGMANAFGVPASFTRDDSEVAQIRAKRARMQQAQDQIALGKEIAEGAATLSKADMEGTNALTALTGGQQQ